MALGTDHFTQADLSAGIPEIWGEQVNDYFRYGLKLANFFTDRSEELSGGGDIIHTMTLSAMSSNTKANGSQVTLNSPTYSDGTITVSIHKEVSFLIEDREFAQLKQSYNLQETLMQGAAYEVAKDLDSAIAALFSGFSTSVGNSTSNCSVDFLMAAIATFENTGVPGLYTDDVMFIMHPNTFYRQLGTQDFYSAANTTGTERPRTQPPTGMFHGIKVITSPAVPNISGSDGRYNLLAHKDAIHWARLSLPVRTGAGYVGSEGVRVQESYVHEYLGTLVTTDLVYGVGENRDNAAVQILTHATVA